LPIKFTKNLHTGTEVEPGAANANLHATGEAFRQVNQSIDAITVAGLASVGSGPKLITALSMAPGAVAASGLLGPSVVGQAQIQSGAAAINVGALGGVLSGTLPNPSFATNTFLANPYYFYASRITSAATGLGPTATNIPYNNVVLGALGGSFNTSTGTWTCGTAGIYVFLTSNYFDTFSTTTGVDSYIFFNISTYAELGYAGGYVLGSLSNQLPISMAAMAPCSVGTTVTVDIVNTAGTCVAAAGDCFFSAYRIA